MDKEDVVCVYEYYIYIYMYIMGCYSAIIKNEIMPFVAHC